MTQRLRIHYSSMYGMSFHEYDIIPTYNLKLGDTIIYNTANIMCINSLTNGKGAGHEIFGEYVVAKGIDLGTDNQVEVWLFRRLPVIRRLY